MILGDALRIGLMRRALCECKLFQCQVTILLVYLLICMHGSYTSAWTAK